MLPNAEAVCTTSPKVIWLVNSRGAWITHGSGTIDWLTDRFQPVNPMLRFTNRR